MFGKASATISAVSIALKVSQMSFNMFDDHWSVTLSCWSGWCGNREEKGQQAWNGYFENIKNFSKFQYQKAVTTCSCCLFLFWSYFCCLGDFSWKWEILLSLILVWHWFDRFQFLFYFVPSDSHSQAGLGIRWRWLLRSGTWQLWRQLVVFPGLWEISPCRCSLTDCIDHAWKQNIMWILEGKRLLNTLLLC